MFSQGFSIRPALFSLARQSAYLRSTQKHPFSQGFIRVSGNREAQGFRLCPETQVFIRFPPCYFFFAGSILRGLRIPSSSHVLCASSHSFSFPGALSSRTLVMAAHSRISACRLACQCSGHGLCDAADGACSCYHEPVLGWWAGVCRSGGLCASWGCLGRGDGPRLCGGAGRLRVWVPSLARVMQPGCCVCAVSTRAEGRPRRRWLRPRRGSVGREGVCGSVGLCACALCAVAWATDAQLK